jgi:hypothetical protein
MAEAVSRFRCIPWNTLSKMPELIIEGGTLDGKQVVSELYGHSVPCRIGECSAFLSHSWHDNGQQKFDALSEWSEDFENENKVSPTLWLDKVCIDQKDVKADLQCLPIFLAACNHLLVISGLTLTSRLWCCVELFVYVQMHVDEEADTAPIIMTIGADSDDYAHVLDGWVHFDAADSQCFDPVDKKRILAVLENHPGGIDAFNGHVRGLGRRLFAASRASLGGASRISGASLDP